MRPRFDSPSVFAALLDHDRGGQFAITPEADGATIRQLYLADTAILVTRFLTEGGVGEGTRIQVIFAESAVHEEPCWGWLRARSHGATAADLRIPAT